MSETNHATDDHRSNTQTHAVTDSYNRTTTHVHHTIQDPEAAKLIAALSKLEAEKEMIQLKAEQRIAQVEAKARDDLLRDAAQNKASALAEVAQRAAEMERQANAHIAQTASRLLEEKQALRRTRNAL